MVANPERGEVNLTVKGAVYTLKLSMNAAVILQKRTGKTVGTLLTECAALDFASIRSVVWLLLQKHHAKEFPSEEKVGDFIDEAGGVSALSDAIIAVQQVNAPEGEPQSEGDGRPPDAQAGTTGESSTSKLAAVV